MISLFASEKAQNGGPASLPASAAAQNGGAASDGEVAGAKRHDIIHRMGRRCRNWDYHDRAIYSITLTLEDRSRHLFGELLPGLTAALKAAGGNVAPAEWPTFVDKVEKATAALSGGEAGGSASSRLRRGMALSEAGLIVEECWQELARNWPGVSPLDCQVMPEHFHGIVFIRERQSKPLGAIIGSFKAKVTSRLREAGLIGEAEAPWKKGFVDVIMFREGQLVAEKNYLADNPRRLAMKRALPDLFQVAAEIKVRLFVSEKAQNGWPASRFASGAAQSGGALYGRFSAIGNRFLLERAIVQIQCSRSLFAYRRIPKSGGGMKILRNADGRAVVEFSQPEFAEKREGLFALAKHGAVLLSPCVSDGERELATLALEAGFPLIVMRNKGFSKLQKPTGKYFDACAAGRLLLLAPAAWPYQPGEKAMSRLDAVAMNRLCQWIAGEGAAEINYHGREPADIDALARESALVAPVAASCFAGDKRGETAAEGCGFSAGCKRGDFTAEGRGFSAGCKRGDFAAEGRGFSADDKRGNFAAEGRGFSADDKRGNFAAEKWRGGLYCVEPLAAREEER